MSHRELITMSEAKRNCMRATECGEERGAKLRAGEQEPVEGVADQGERARNREAHAIKGRRRKSGGGCSEGVRSYLGISRLALGQPHLVLSMISMLLAAAIVFFLRGIFGY
jgi:hypothetical protein